MQQHLPQASFGNLDDQVTRAITLIQAGKTEDALSLGLSIVKAYPDRAQGYALCAHLLSQGHDSELSLWYWERAIEQDPLDTSWLPQAIRTALAADRRDLALSWLRGVEKQYTSPPVPGVLRLAAELDLDLRGAVGVYKHAVQGWIKLEPGQRPTLRTFGPDRVQMRLRPITRGADNQLFRLTIPLDLSEVLILHILDADGMHLPGSPVYCEPPALVARYCQSARKQSKRQKSKKSPRKKKSSPSRPEVTVIVPVYDDRQATLDCLQALEASRSLCATRFQIMTVWDDGPEESLLASLKELAARERITLLINQWNMGFVNSVNRALAQSAGTDAVLLNSDALVQGSWLDRMRRHALSSDNVGTVTPLSNYGELVSYPHPLTPGEISTLEQIRRIDLAAQSLGLQDEDKVPELPVGVGFCMYIRSSLLERIGGLDSTRIHRGYGEEVDFCLRARTHCFQNRCAPDVFVGHLGGRSFGREKRRLALQNNQVLYALYPDYRSQYRAFLQQDPLKKIREQISFQLLHELSGPLWVLDTSHRQQPLWQETQDRLKAGNDSWACVLASPRGRRIQLTIQVQAFDLPMADIHLTLPRDLATFQSVIRQLAPQRINALGPGPGAQALVQSLPDEVHLYLTALPKSEKTARQGGQEAALESLAGYASITCLHRELADWLGKGHPGVSCVPGDFSPGISQLPQFLFKKHQKGHTLLACGLNEPQHYQRLVSLARECMSRNIRLWALGGDAWHPFFPPPGVQDAPLTLADLPEIWQTTGVRELLVLDPDPAYFPQWWSWARARGMEVYAW
ncbi:MAG: glycosyltransferase [Desulfohalobiaceae bacterium]|nr:glycosyltransferase [Desulfohalobiaceae bacterium]